jgi:hypothetical protein
MGNCALECVLFAIHLCSFLMIGIHDTNQHFALRSRPKWLPTSRQDFWSVTFTRSSATDAISSSRLIRPKFALIKTSVARRYGQIVRGIGIAGILSFVIAPP